MCNLANPPLNLLSANEWSNVGQWWIARLSLSASRLLEVDEFKMDGAPQDEWLFGQILSQWTCIPMIIVNKFITNAPYNYGINTWIRWLVLRTQRFCRMWPYCWRFGDVSERTLTILLLGVLFLWNWNESLTPVTYFHIIMEILPHQFWEFSGSTLDERLFIWLPVIFICYGNFTSSLLGIFLGSTPDERLLNFAATCCNVNTELYYGTIYVLILGLCHMPINFIYCRHTF